MDPSRQEFIELLKAQHSFPGPYTLKFIGQAEDDFTDRIVTAVREALSTEQTPPFTTRPSKSRELVSVTLMPIVSSPDQVVSIYERVQKVRGLKVSL